MNAQKPAGVGGTNNPLKRYNQRLKSIFGQRLTRFQTLTTKLDDAHDWLSTESRVFSSDFPISSFVCDEQTPQAIKSKLKACYKRALALVKRVQAKEIAFFGPEDKSVIYIQSEKADLDWEKCMHEAFQEQETATQIMEAKVAGIHEDLLGSVEEINAENALVENAEKEQTGVDGGCGLGGVGPCEETTWVGRGRG